LAETQGIYILAETNEDNNPTALSCELLWLGERIASGMGIPLRAILIGGGVTAGASELARYGVSEVLYLDHPDLAHYDPENYGAILAGLLASREPLVLLAGHTSMGQDLLPRLAFSLGCGLVTDCTGLEVEGSEVLFSRPVYGGNALATQKVETPTILATVRARVGEIPSPAGDAATLTALDAELPAPSRLQVMDRVRLAARECPLEEAPVVISGGRGIGGEEGFEMLRELAGLLGGAVGASRPPVDSGWAPTTSQVGITGKVVAPGIYFAVAISGSTQHLSGMGESGKIVGFEEGVSNLLRDLDVTLRKDKESGRPRINKKGSVLDREQKAEDKWAVF